MNASNPAVKRSLADCREMSRNKSSRYHAAPLEDNVLEWHFTIRGPKETDFEGGIYHGRIILPTEYPFKPPHIVFLTPNGRFDVGVKICLSISAYHPEEWKPAWGIRAILVALISFMPTNGEGAIGAVEWSSDDRKHAARESLNFECPICGKVCEKLPLQTEDEIDCEHDLGLPQLSLSKPKVVAEDGDQEKSNHVTSDEIQSHSPQIDSPAVVVREEEKQNEGVEEVKEVAAVVTPIKPPVDKVDRFLASVQVFLLVLLAAFVIGKLV